MKKSEYFCKNSDLCICLGTSLQIMPVGNYPLLTKKNSGKVVVINLQKTRIDKNADLVINCKLDICLKILFEEFFLMNLKVPRPNQILLLKLKQDIENDIKLLDVSNISIEKDFLLQ